MTTNTALAQATARGMVFVHSAPAALQSHVEWAIGGVLGMPVQPTWQTQPVLNRAFRTELSWEGPQGTGAQIASALRGWNHLRFEVTEDATPRSDGGRWLHTPDLGIFYAQTDALGNIVVPEDRIRYALEIAGNDMAELKRELGVALGQAWDDELEAFRTAGDHSPVVWLHRVS